MDNDDGPHAGAAQRVVRQNAGKRRVEACTRVIPNGPLDIGIRYGRLGRSGQGCRRDCFVSEVHAAIARAIHGTARGGIAEEAGRHLALVLLDIEHDGLEDRIAGCLHIVGKNRLRIASGEEDVGAGDLRGIAVADLQQFRWNETNGDQKSDGGSDERTDQPFQELEDDTHEASRSRVLFRRALTRRSSGLLSQNEQQSRKLVHG